MFKRRIILIFVILIATLIGISSLSQPEIQSSKVNASPEITKLAIIQGNSLMPISFLPNSEPQIVQKFLAIITAYSSTPWETDDTPYITAAGTLVREGIIANNLFPFGTKVRIPEIYGDKVFIVEDRMHWRKGYYHFDIWFSSYWEAKNFGARRTYVEILES